VARLPAVPPALPALRSGDVYRAGRAARLVRVYFAGRHSATWHGFRTWGPTATGRFDPHVPPPEAHVDRGVMYAAGDPRTALVEAFGRTAVLDRRRDEPWLVVIALRRRVRLLDLRGSWPTYAGASQALATAEAPAATQAWARAVHESYDVDGILYPSSMRGRPTDPKPDALDADFFGNNIALFGRAADAIPAHPRLHLSLDHPGLDEVLAEIALRYRYALL
jgi:hypothetical protein